MSFRGRLPSNPDNDGDEDNESTDSSAEEMKLSRDYYPSRVVIGLGESSSGAIHLGESSRAMPSMSDTSTGRLRGRTYSMGKQGGSGLSFKSDYFGKEIHPSTGSGHNVSQGSVSDQRDPNVDNIALDLPHLSEIGYIIEYPDQFLGEGFYGAVYRGYLRKFTPEEQNKPLEYFAAKIIEFDTDKETERRERYETEKYILTCVSHRNICPVRMIINMGDFKLFAFIDDPAHSYISPDRVYLIMDFADKGELQSYLDRTSGRIPNYERVNFIRDLFAGMAYLHSEDIIHGDVHTGNVLLFTDKAENVVVAKWADFGMGFVDQNKQYRFKTLKTHETKGKYRKDISDMSSVFNSILARRDVRNESPGDKQVLDELSAMSRTLRTTCSLKDTYLAHTDVLAMELVFTSGHF